MSVFDGEGPGQDEGYGVAGRHAPQMIEVVTSNQGTWAFRIPFEVARMEDDLIIIPFRGVFYHEEKWQRREWAIIVKGTKLKALAKYIRAGQQYTIKLGSKEGAAVTEITIDTLEVEEVFS